MGVSVIIKEAFTALVRLTPLKKANILIPTPKREQSTSFNPSSFQSIFSWIENPIVQNANVATATRITIYEKGVKYSGVTILSTL